MTGELALRVVLLTLSFLRHDEAWRTRLISRVFLRAMNLVVMCGSSSGFSRAKLSLIDKMNAEFETIVTRVPEPCVHNIEWEGLCPDIVDRCWEKVIFLSSSRLTTVDSRQSTTSLPWSEEAFHMFNLLSQVDRAEQPALVNGQANNEHAPVHSTLPLRLELVTLELEDVHCVISMVLQEVFRSTIKSCPPVFRPIHLFQCRMTLSSFLFQCSYFLGQGNGGRFGQSLVKDVLLKHLYAMLTSWTHYTWAQCELVPFLGCASDGSDVEDSVDSGMVENKNEGGNDDSVTNVKSNAKTPPPAPDASSLSRYFSFWDSQNEAVACGHVATPNGFKVLKPGKKVGFSLNNNK